MNNIYQIIAGLSLDHYIEERNDKKDVENVLDQNPCEVIDKIALSIRNKLEPDKKLINMLESFYNETLSRSIVENIFIDIDLQEKNINGIGFFIAFSNYIAKEETQFIVEEILKKRGYI